MTRMMDERVKKENNRLMARAFWLMLMLQAVVLAVKLALGGGLRFCALDLLVLFIGTAGVVLLRTVRSLWSRKDEALQEMDDEQLSGLYMVMFVVQLLGEFLLIFGDGQNMAWYVPTLLVWFLPALYFTVICIKKGLFLWGGRKQQRDAKKPLRASTAIGSLFYGVVMAAGDCFVDGVFQPVGLLKVLGMAASFGVIYYVLMVLMLNLGEKAADKAEKAAEADEDA